MATKQTDFAHRASWRIFKGEIPKGILVCHHCDVRLCVNPEHLFLGTARDNMRDAATKGRIVTPAANYASDETHQVAILTNAQVREIRASGDASRDLAVRFGVSYWAIWLARTGRTFRGVR